MLPRLHLVDGTYELFRAHFSPRPRRYDPSGVDVTASVGMVASLLALLDDADEAVTHIAVAFDNPIESFRNERFSGYKSSAGVDPVLLNQFDRVEEGVAAAGVVTWRMAHYEADDALATAAVRWQANTSQVRIMTPDKDLGQVVAGSSIVQVDRSRKRETDETGVIEKFGVPPGSIPDYLALVGDAADGIPGLAGFGAKSAAALLREYGSLDAIPVDTPWDVSVRGAARLQETFHAQRADALLYRELATLVTDVPLAEQFDDLAFAGTEPGEFALWCAQMGAESMAARPRRLRGEH